MTDAPNYRSKRMRAIHGLPPRAGIPAAKWTPEQTPGRLFQPWRLTLALDMGDLYDPELSKALDCAVGEVDRWEEGMAMPTDEQAKILAELTGYPLAWFYKPGPPPQMDTVFMCGPRGGGAVEPTEYVALGRGRWKIKADRPDALLPDVVQGTLL